MGVARDLRHCFDPAAFCAERLGFMPDSWQATVLTSASKRILLCCSRQSGKSTIAAALATYEAHFFANSLALVFSPSLRQSTETFAKINAFVGSLGSNVVTESTKTTLKLANGSRVVSLPASPDTVRGYSAATLLIIDEAARVETTLYHAIRPMLAASNGRLILASTPAGLSDHFFPTAWHGEGGWERINVTADQCPRISPSFLAEERQTLGDRWFNAEYMCSFVHSVDQLFSHDVVMGAMSDGVEPIFPDAPLAETDELVSDRVASLAPGGSP
jgi:hypothetical protein